MGRLSAMKVQLELEINFGGDFHQHLDTRTDFPIYLYLCSLAEFCPPRVL